MAANMGAPQQIEKPRRRRKSLSVPDLRGVAFERACGILWRWMRDVVDRLELFDTNQERGGITPFEFVSGEGDTELQVGSLVHVRSDGIAFLAHNAAADRYATDVVVDVRGKKVWCQNIGNMDVLCLPFADNISPILYLSDIRGFATDTEPDNLTGITTQRIGIKKGLRGLENPLVFVGLRIQGKDEAAKVGVVAGNPFEWVTTGTQKDLKGIGGTWDLDTSLAFINTITASENPMYNASTMTGGPPPAVPDGKIEVTLGSVSYNRVTAFFIGVYPTGWWEVIHAPTFMEFRNPTIDELDLPGIPDPAGNTAAAAGSRKAIVQGDGAYVFEPDTPSLTSSYGADASVSGDVAAGGSLNAGTDLVVAGNGSFQGGTTTIGSSIVAPVDVIAGSNVLCFTAIANNDLHAGDGVYAGDPDSIITGGDNIWRTNGHLRSYGNLQVLRFNNRSNLEGFLLGGHELTMTQFRFYSHTDGLHIVSEPDGLAYTGTAQIKLDNNTIVTGTLNVSGVVTGSSFTGAATGLTGIPAGQLTGAIADARLSANIPLKNAANTFTAEQTVPSLTLSAVVGHLNSTDVNNLFDWDVRVGATLNATAQMRIGRNTNSGTGTLSTIWFKGDNTASTAMVLDHKLGTLSVTGGITDASLSSNVPRKNAANTFTPVQTFGGVRRAIATHSASYAVTANDHTIILAGAGSPVTLTLPAPASCAGQEYSFFYGDTGADGHEVVTPSGVFRSAANIGATTMNSITFGHSMTIVSDGTDWWVTANNGWAEF